MAHEFEFPFKLGTFIDWFISDSVVIVFPCDVDISVFVLFSDWLGSSQLILNLVTLGSDAKIFLVTYGNQINYVYI